MAVLKHQISPLRSCLKQKLGRSSCTCTSELYMKHTSQSLISARRRLTSTVMFSVRADSRPAKRQRGFVSRIMLMGQQILNHTNQRVIGSFNEADSKMRPCIRSSLQRVFQAGPSANTANGPNTATLT